MLCRLCVRESISFLNIFDSDGIKMDIAGILGRHFWFKPRADDRMTTAICTMCWAKVYNFHQFYLAVEQAHSKLSATNVQKDFVSEYVWNEFIDKDVALKEEYNFFTLEEEKVLEDPEFIEINVNAEELIEAPSSKTTERKESACVEFDPDAEGLLADPRLNHAQQKEQNNAFTKLNTEGDICDILNKECYELQNVGEEISLSRVSIQEPELLTEKHTKIIKRRKRVVATEKQDLNLKEKRVVRNTRSKKNISLDESSSQCNVVESPLTDICIDHVNNKKRTTKTKLPKLGEKCTSKELFTDASLTNHDSQEPALKKPIEPITDASFSYCDEQKPALNSYTEHFAEDSLSSCDDQERSQQKSVEHIEDASSHCDPLEPIVSKFTKHIANASLKKSEAQKPIKSDITKTVTELKATKKKRNSAKDRKKLKSRKGEVLKLREKRGIHPTCNDNELVKKYISMRCDICIFECEEFEDLKNHYRSEHPDIKPYVKCCNRKWAHWLEIVHHAYKHDDPELLRCHECKKDFNDVQTLSWHMMDFHAPEEDKIFSCDLCSKKFARKKKLDIHRNLHIPLSERPFVCDKCPNSRFANEAMLRVHNRNTHRRAHFVCHVCAKKIKTKMFFEKHVRLHFEESGPKVKCTFEGCDSWLKDEDNLRLHIRRAHNKNKDKIFTCEICGGEYKSRASYTSHMLRVHPKKTYPCDICNKHFKKEWTLREHMAQHTGEKNYQCPFCTSTFNVTGNFYSHLKNMHAAEYENWRKNNANKKILIKVKS